MDSTNKSFFSAKAFSITYACIILSFATTGMSSYIFGFFVYTNVSTWFIYFALIFQIISKSLRFPKILIFIYLFVFVHTFVINFNINSFGPSLKQFIGLLVFSISIFSFITVYKDHLGKIIKIYYKFVIFIAIISILQILLFVFFNYSFIPQNIISGTKTAIQSNYFKPEILGIFPRAVALSSEPSHFAILALPGVYISLLALSGRGSEFGIYNKISAITIILGLLLSFSLMGYLGLALCLFVIFANQLKRNLVKKILILTPFLAIFLLSFHSPIGNRVTSLFEMLKNPKEYRYTSSTLSGWALVSNMAVAGEALKESHYLGTGLNTHVITYDAVIHKLFSPDQILIELNKDNAGSMFIRIISEFGLLGIISLIVFLLHYRLGKKDSPSTIKSINNMSLVILIIYCLRNGIYLNNLFILFLAIYYTSYFLEKSKVYDVS